MAGPTRNVGAKVVLDGEKEYKQALQELNTGNRTLASEMKKLQAEFKGNTESTEYLTKAGELLERQLLQQQDKVKKLREAVAFSAKEYGEASETTQGYIQQLNNAEAAEFDLKHAIEENAAALSGENKEMVGLGDTVDVMLKGGRTVEAKITKTVFDSLSERWTSIELGKEKLMLSKYIAKTR